MAQKKDPPEVVQHRHRTIGRSTFQNGNRQNFEKKNIKKFLKISRSTNQFQVGRNIEHKDDEMSN